MNQRFYISQLFFCSPESRGKKIWLSKLLSSGRLVSDPLSTTRFYNAIPNTARLGSYCGIGERLLGMRIALFITGGSFPVVSGALAANSLNLLSLLGFPQVPFCHRLSSLATKEHTPPGLSLCTPVSLSLSLFPLCPGLPLNLYHIAFARRLSLTGLYSIRKTEANFIFHWNQIMEFHLDNENFIFYPGIDGVGNCSSGVNRRLVFERMKLDGISISESGIRWRLVNIIIQYDIIGLR